MQLVLLFVLDWAAVLTHMYRWQLERPLWTPCLETWIPHSDLPYAGRGQSTSDSDTD
jgi:hypothetical protein